MEELYSFFEKQSDINIPNNETTYYCILDTREGSDCFGHWIHECALFLPFVQTLREIYPTLKILLHCKRRYKINTLIDFGFTEDNIEYSNLMLSPNDCKCYKWYKPCYEHHYCHGWVCPIKKNYVAFLPKFPFINVVDKENPLLLELAKAFKEFYGVYSPSPKEKTIPFLYLIRSRKENYDSPNKRDFLNLDEMLEMFKKYNIEILDIDTLTSIKEQVEKVQQAKIIINEFSAACVNDIFFSIHSHVLVLNKQPVGENLFNVMEHFLHDSKSTWEFFLTTTDDWHKYSVNLKDLEKRIIELRDKMNSEIH